MNPPPTDKLIGITDLTIKFRLSKAQARRVSQKGDFPAPVGIIGGRGVHVWRESDVNKWIGNNLTQVTKWRVRYHMRINAE